MKKEIKKYGVLAFVMVLLLGVGFSLVEGNGTVNLLGMAFFCLLCSGVLLYALMKLNVMEFQAGSYWERVNRKIQGETQSTVVYMLHGTDSAKGQRNFSGRSDYYKRTA